MNNEIIKIFEKKYQTDLYIIVMHNDLTELNWLDHLMTVFEFIFTHLNVLLSDDVIIIIKLTVN